MASPCPCAQAAEGTLSHTEAAKAEKASRSPETAAEDAHRCVVAEEGAAEVVAYARNTPPHGRGLINTAGKL